MKEIHYFYQGLLCLILACYVLKGNSCFLLYINLGVALPHAHGATASAHPLKQQIQHDQHQYHRQNNRYKNIDQQPSAIRWDPAEIHVLGKQPC